MTGTKARVRPNLASGVPGVGVMRDGAVRPSLGSRQPTSPWPVEEGMLVNCSPSRIGGPTSFANRLDPLLREGPHHPSHTHLLKASLTKGSRVQLGAQWALGDGNLRTEGSVVWGSSQGAGPGHRCCTELCDGHDLSGGEGGWNRATPPASGCHVLRCPEPPVLWDSRNGLQGKEAGGGAQLCATPTPVPSARGRPRRPPSPGGGKTSSSLLQRPGRFLKEAHASRRPAGREGGPHLRAAALGPELPAALSFPRLRSLAQNPAGFSAFRKVNALDGGSISPVTGLH